MLNEPVGAAESLARDFVENATEWDWAELPDHVRGPVLEAATIMLTWMRDSSQVIVPGDDDAEPLLPEWVLLPMFHGYGSQSETITRLVARAVERRG